MTKSVTIDYAEANLSRLITEVEAGDEIVISRGTNTVVRLVKEAPAPMLAGKRIPGRLAGILKVSDNFWEPLPPEALSGWYEQVPNPKQSKKRVPGALPV